MKKSILPQRMYALLLNERHVSAGEGDIEGTHRIWGDSYKITFLPFEDHFGTSVKTYKVAKGIEDQVSEKLCNAGWGSIIRLVVENNFITELDMMFDLSEYAPIE